MTITKDKKALHPDAIAYILQPPTEDEFGSDDELLGLDAEGWDAYAPSEQLVKEEEETQDEEEEEESIPSTIFEIYDNRFINIDNCDLEILKHLP